jgi:ribosome-associated translation inhibitor RaiA
VKTVKVKWEELHAKLTTSHGKKMFCNYECTVHCSNIAINNANNFMTPYESTDLAAVKTERTLFAG